MMTFFAWFGIGVFAGLVLACLIVLASEVMERNAKAREFATAIEDATRKGDFILSVERGRAHRKREQS